MFELWFGRLCASECVASTRLTYTTYVYRTIRSRTAKVQDILKDAKRASADHMCRQAAHISQRNLIRIVRAARANEKLPLYLLLSSATRSEDMTRLRRQQIGLTRDDPQLLRCLKSITS